METVELLAQLGANLNATDNDGDGAAIIASKNHYYKMAKLLMELDVNAEIVNKEGECALSYAKEIGPISEYDNEMISILTKKR